MSLERDRHIGPESRNCVAIAGSDDDVRIKLEAVGKLKTDSEDS